MKNKIIKYILLVLLSFVLTLGNFENLCRIYPNLNPDNQALLLWKYTTSIGLLPYRDIFYPYGFLNYYLSQNIFFATIYVVMPALLLLGVFLAIQKIAADRFYIFLSFSLFYLFILFFTGFETFIRYGSLVVFSTIFAYTFFSSKNKSSPILFGLGFLTGAFFLLTNDVSFYAVIIFVFLSVCDKFIRDNKPDKILPTVKELVIFALGYVAGIAPFLIFLAYNQSLGPFLDYLVSYGEIAKAAKTPFFHSIFTPDNLLTLSVLIVAVSVLSFKLFFRKIKPTFNTYFQIGLVGILVLLEQKSILRTIDTQLTFITLLLLLTYLFEIIEYFKKYKISKLIPLMYFINIAIILLFVVGLNSVDKKTIQYPSIDKANRSIERFRNNSCIFENTNHIAEDNENIIEVVNEVVKKRGFNGKVFTFPGEPIFYVLLNQAPPYYPTIYEASPILAQKKLVSYIKEEKINVIVYNYKIVSIHDEVPDIVRGRLLYEYIRNNYTIKKTVNGYYLMEKNININDQK